MNVYTVTISFPMVIAETPEQAALVVHENVILDYEATELTYEVENEWTRVKTTVCTAGMYQPEEQ